MRRMIVSPASAPELVSNERLPTTQPPPGGDGAAAAAAATIVGGGGGGPDIHALKVAGEKKCQSCLLNRPNLEQFLLIYTLQISFVLCSVDRKVKSERWVIGFCKSTRLCNCVFPRAAVLTSLPDAKNFCVCVWRRQRVWETRLGECEGR